MSFPDIPTPAKTRDFQRDLTTMLNSASGLFDNSVVPWAQYIWANNTTFENLATCEPKFQLLDQQLAGAAQVALKEGKPNVTFELARRINRRGDEAIAQGVMLTGRQYVWILLDWLRTDSRLQTYYTMDHLSAIEWQGDAHIEVFIDHWDRILGQMAPAQLRNIEDRPDIEPSIIQTIFAAKTNQSKDENIRHALRQYNAAHQDADKETFSYRFLRKAVDAAMERRHVEKQHAAQTKELTQLASGAGKTNKLAPVVGDGKGKAKGKGKDNDQVYTKEQREENGPCWWHLAKVHGYPAAAEGCFRKEKCRFTHNVQGITKAQWEAMPKPERRGKGDGKGGGGKGKGDGARSRSNSPNPHNAGAKKPCLDLIIHGKCEKPDCQREHKAYKNIHKRTIAAAAKAKAAPAVPAAAE